MNMKKILTFDDLYDFYLNQNKTCNFSSKESGYQISIQIPAQFEINKEQNDDTLLFCKVKLMHSGENRNHSSVTEDALQKCSKTLAYKPILANFMEYIDEETGETLEDFTSHDMIQNDDGTTTYIEKQVGCFTSDEPFFEVEEETKHNFLYGYCAIPRDYTSAATILERKDGSKISVELAVNEMQYNASSHVLELTDVIIMGATLLGKNSTTHEDVGEGMLNARVDIADFSTENNSLFNDYESKFAEMQERLNKLESACFDIEKNTKGGTELKKENFEEEVTTTEEVTETSEEEVTTTEEESEEAVEETSEEENQEASEDSSDEDETSTSEQDQEEESEVSENIVEYSFIKDGEIKKFAVSLQDKIYAIQDLVNATYAEADNTYYGVYVYDDYVIMCDYWTGKYFKQTYKDEEDIYSLTGDRVEVFAEFVTAEEQEELNSMRSNYSSIVEKLAKYEEADELADKATVFEDEAYVDYLDTEEFKTLMSEDTLKKFSKEELKEKADAAYGRVIKSKKNFSLDTQVEVAKKKRKNVTIFSDMEPSKENSIYGDYFKSI